MRVRARVMRLLALAAVSGLLLFTLGARAHVIPESQQKAAFLYNLTRFVVWPRLAFADEAAPISLCLIGRDPLGADLDAFRDRMAQGRRVAVTRLSSAAQARSCHVLFICASESERVRVLLDSLRGLPVLTVSDIEHFTSEGGVIGLTTARQRVRLEVNMDAARQKGLKISSRLLNMSRVIGRDA